ncbi:MAG: phosphate transport system substrate-binding protein [Acidimicrobiaceae bacterium]|jgi:phosphate transport system substrate-binding protein|nr:phosphate transport system substrate-binding protein [Acidimicrobiaceae bacterium]
MNTRSSRCARLAVLLAVVATVATACGSSSKKSSTGSTATPAPAQAPLASATLNESGSTFQFPYLQEVAKQFSAAHSGVTINVAPGGSGKGRQDLADQVVDFAATDALPKPEELSKFKGGPLLDFPTVAAPITVSYNLSGVNSLKLDADTIAKIFERQIKSWDDPAIAALNPGAKLPSKPITVAHRSDSSGTTQNFTTYLKAAAPSTWTLDAGSTVQWPTDTQAGNGNAGVAQIIKSGDGGIGYVDFSDAKALALKFADIKNSAGKFVTPSLDGTSVALEQATVNPDLSYNPLNAAGDKAYPIATPTWIIAYKNQTDKAKGAALKSFLQFVYAKGQDIAGTVDYAKLSPNILDKAKAQLELFAIAS